MKRPMIVSVLLLPVLACAEDPADDAVPTWHQDVEPIVTARCAQCHTDGGIGPFELGSYADAAALAPSIAASVAARTMPPWGAVSGHQDYLADPSLSDEQIDTVLRWADGGAPEGDPGSPGEPLAPLVGPSLRADITLQMAEPYTPNADVADDYRCFVLDWQEDDEVFVTGFDVLPGNNRVVHHVAAFLIGPDTIMGDAVFEMLAEWDAAEDGPGYTCYGGPSGKNASQLPIAQIAQWVPGMDGLQFPEGTGLSVLPGSKIVLQMHYNNPPEGPSPDQTTVELQVEPSVEKKALFAPFLDVSWPLGGMELPPGQTTTHEAEGDPRSLLAILGDGGLDLSGGFNIHSVLMHMHVLGQHGIVEVEHADGSEDTVVEVDPYDFNWQLIYQLSQPVRFEHGDTMSLRCTFENDTDAAVFWGEGTEEEMCVGNLYISEL